MFTDGDQLKFLLAHAGRRLQPKHLKLSDTTEEETQCHQICVCKGVKLPNTLIASL